MWMMLFTVAMTAVAQDNSDDKNNGGRLEAMKIAWLTKKLELTPEEAQKFWPIYNQYTKDIQNTRKEARERKDDEIKTQEKLLNIRKKYETEFLKANLKRKSEHIFPCRKGVFGRSAEKNPRASPAARQAQDQPIKSY